MKNCLMLGLILFSVSCGSGSTSTDEGGASPTASKPLSALNLTMNGTEDVEIKAQLPAEGGGGNSQL